MDAGKQTRFLDQNPRLRMRRRVWRTARIGALCVCCAMAGLCLIALMVSRSHVVGLSFAMRGSSWHGGIEEGLVSVSYCRHVVPLEGPTGLRSFVIESPRRWGDVLNPVSTTLAAAERTGVGHSLIGESRVVTLPLVAVANLFAIWPVLYAWRLCRAKRQAVRAGAKFELSRLR